MTIKSLFIRFLLVYLALLFVGGVIVNTFDVKGSSFNTAILLGAVIWACMSYGQKNGYYLNSSERRKVWLGITAIDLVLQLLLALLVLPSMPGTMLWGVLFGSMAFVCALHAAVIYFFVSYSGKLLAKQGLISDSAES